MQTNFALLLEIVTLTRLTLLLEFPAVAVFYFYRVLKFTLNHTSYNVDYSTNNCTKSNYISSRVHTTEEKLTLINDVEINDNIINWAENWTHSIHNRFNEEIQYPLITSLILRVFRKEEVKIRILFQLFFSVTISENKYNSLFFILLNKSCNIFT